MKVAVIGAGAIGGLVAGYLVEKCAYLKDVPVISVQNGVRAERIIAERLGAQRLFPSIVMFGATYLAPGKIVHNFEGDWIVGQANAGPNDMLHEITKVTSKIFPSPDSGAMGGIKWLKLFITATNCR